MKTENQIKGKKNRQAGARFELKVRKDLEENGWVVVKWTNNIEFMCKHKEECCARLVKVKNKFRGKGIPMMLGVGFPDFVAFKLAKEFIPENEKLKEIYKRITNLPYHVFGVECKSNGYLLKEEKEKCKWLLDNNIFSKILIAKKGIKRGKIVYLDFKSNIGGTKMAEDEEEKKEESEESKEDSE